MSKVTFILKDGSKCLLEVPDGTTVMRAAVDNMVDGIIGECGGLCNCGTCHVYVREGASELTAPSGEENDMLEGVVAERRDNSRLGCQISLRPALDGLVVEMPESQR